MNFTFGIITSGNSDKCIEEIVQSIRVQQIPLYEIIIVGNTGIKANDITNIEFDETIQPGWITRKKNIVCQTAMYDTIVLLHDYVRLDSDWYTGFLKYNTDFDICVTRIETKDGQRFRDFLLFPNGLQPFFQNGSLLPYDYIPSTNVSKLMYISGAYYVIKKNIALQYPLNEELCHNMGEDIDLCHRLSKSGIVFKCNQFSSVKLLKDKPLVGWENEISPDELKMLNEFDEEDLSFLFKKQEFTFSNWLSAIKMKKGYIPIVKGGMGNQMFIVAAAYVAHKSSGFPLYILKKHVSQNKHNVHRNDYNKSLFKYFGTHIDNNSNFLQYISYTEYNPPFFEKWLIPAPGALMVSHFMYYPNIAPFEHDICDLFLKGLEEFRGKLGDYSNYCFLHVRRGDFLDNSDIHVTQEVDYYSAAIEKMKPIKIIIVTNDIDWVRSHAVFDGIEIFEGNELETMALMTKCTAGAIIANSTFSWWGALLGAHLHKNTVIYPNAKNWYLTVDKLEIFPESWISLP